MTDLLQILQGDCVRAAIELGRKCIGIDLNPDYCALARSECAVTPGLALA